jgi:hypothetical protein
LTGLLYESRGNAPEAINRYTAAHNLSSNKSWQPLLRIGLLLERLDRRRDAAPFLHQCRIMRPDLGMLVNEKLKNL